MDSLFKKLVGSLCIYLFVFNLYAQTSVTPIICDQKYALCTSARCIPIPGSVTDTICDCVVEEGKSVGYRSCEQRKPNHEKNNVTSLISTFSFVQFTTRKPMNCPKGLPWSNCVDRPCIMDPQNSKRALCKCKIDNTHAFITFGGACKTNTCATGFWSGATSEMSLVLRNALMQKTNANLQIEHCDAQPSSH